MSATLKVPASSLRRVKTAMEKVGISSQKALAEAVGISLYKVREFMAGRPIDATTFIQICEKLELDWQKLTRVSPAKAEGILGKEAAPPASPPALVPPPTPKRSVIPRLASHLFRANLPQEVAPPSPLEETVPNATLDTPSEEHAAVHQSLPAPVETPPLSISEEAVPTVVITAPTSPPPIEEQPEPRVVITADSPTAPMAEKTVPTVVITADVPAAPSEELAPPIPIVEKTAATVVITPTVPPAQNIEIEPPTFTIAATPSVEEMIVTEEGNLPVIEPVVPHREPPIDWASILEGARTLVANAQWEELAQVLQRFDLSQTHLYDLFLELAESLLPPHWRQGGRRVSDPILHGWILALAGIVAHYLELYPQALAYLELALKLVKQYPDRALELQCFKGLAQLHYALANYQAAISYYQQYYDLAELEDRFQEQAQVLHQLGNIYFALRQYRTAIGYYQQFLNHTAAELLETETHKTLYNIGACYINLKQYEQAINHLQKLASLGQDEPTQQARTNLQLGLAYAGLGLHHTALEYLERARSLAAPLNYPHLDMQIWRGLTLSYLGQNNYSQADRYGRKWLTLAKLIGDRDEQVRAIYYLRRVNRTSA
ncbi:MAG: tetratricopeptide repeat protein [Pseudanabaenaceae cyanobacterium SKYGB_i_bin29]|nr:tetratricopeptide repeat protein [Pseudanabaenaceae cyanobacterium SKYG29]MDW8421239.1 tetratricopeptide repeat protein [Pseudanabaenaceae cyanobacterium SKYGB_i_bin29]